MTATTLPGLNLTATPEPEPEPVKLGRHPAWRHCPACGAWTTAAIRAMTSEPVHCDPTPTTTEGELIALMNGRRTFFVSNYYGIEQRFDFDILDCPADKAGNVHPEHQCNGQQLPTHPEHTPKHQYFTDKTGPAPF